MYLLSFSTTFFLVVALRPAAYRFGLLDAPGHRKIHDSPVPLIGGIAIFLGFLFAAVLFGPHSARLDAFLAGGGLLVAVGALDDRLELSHWLRFAAQIAAGLIMVFWGGLVIDDLGGILGSESQPLGKWAIPFTVFGTVGVINAINMIDGVDGLAGTICVVALGILGVVALGNGASEAAHIAFGLGCATLAFLYFNMRLPGRAKAAIFLGDAGSMLLGYAISWLLVTLTQQPVAAINPVTALWLLAVPLIDTVSIMFRRILKGRSPFAPDKEHLHHILMVAGYSVCQTTLIMGALSLTVGGICILADYFGASEQLMFFLFLGLFAAHFLGMLRAWKVMKAIPRPKNARRGYKGCWD
jgi:UDP-GlcNAc:undecaprenyl-phosphate GlcNAc-1-phosphate transferase